MTGATPWWGTLLVATLGLAGVLTSQWLTTRREMRSRLLDQTELSRRQRVDTYAEFMASYQKVLDLIKVDPRPGDFDSQLAVSWNDLSVHYYRCLLLAQRDLAAGVAELLKALRDLGDATANNASDSAIRTIEKQLGKLFLSVAPAMRRDSCDDYYWTNLAVDAIDTSPQQS